MTTSASAEQPTRSAAFSPSGRLYRRLVSEVTNAGLPAGAAGLPITDREISDLPQAAQRYLRYMRVVGRPADWSFRARFAGRFRRRPNGPWLPAEAWQYNSGIEVGRVFVLRVLMGHVLPMVGRDTYLRGHGHLLGKLLGFTVVDGKGEEFDSAELVIWLNDVVFLAPSMLLRPGVRWDEVDADSFDVSLTDARNTVTARVFLNQDGAPVDFRAERWATLPGGLALAPWRTPVSGWQIVNGRPLPGPAAVLYELADGPFSYFEGRFDPDSVAYNLPPGPELGRRHVGVN